MREHNRQILYLPPHHFGQAYQLLSLALFNDLYHRFTCVHHTSYLALTRVVVPRKALLLRFAPHILRCFVTLSELLFIQAREFIRQHGWFPPGPISENSSFNDFVSQVYVKGSQEIKRLPIDKTSLALQSPLRY